MKALVYLRVSTEDQAEKGYSIQAQRIECISKANQLGCSNEGVFIFSDEGVSGAVLERPQLMAALDMLKKKEKGISYFICYDSSRLSRNAAHQLIIVDEIKKSGVQLVFIRNSFQDNAEGRFQLTVMAAVDEYERARLRLRTEMGKRTKASQCKLTHNPGLYGYDFDSKTDTLIINEEQKKNLQMMFALLTEELDSPAVIAEKLNEAGIPSPRLKFWNRVTVRRILSNQSYLGTLYIRRYDTRDCHLNKFRGKGEKIKVREKPKNEWVPVQIPPIIDDDIWEKAQSMLKKPSRNFKTNGKKEFLLNPFIKCGICGNRMNGKKIVKGNRSYSYYICTAKYKNKIEINCRSGLVKADEIETEVWKQLYERIGSYIEKELKPDKLLDAFMLNRENDNKNIIMKQEKAKKERDRIATMFQKGYMSEDEMAKRMGGIEAVLASLGSAAAVNNEMRTQLSDCSKKYELEEKLPYTLKEMLNSLDNNDKRFVLEQLVSDITVVFPDDTTLVGNVPESYITVPEGDIPNYVQSPDPYDGK